MSDLITSLQSTFGKQGLKSLVSWSIATLVFLIIAGICVRTLFTPITTVYEDNSGIYRTQQPALSIPGMKDIARAWKENPDYRNGLIASIFFSFGGAFYCIYNIAMVKKIEDA